MLDVIVYMSRFKRYVRTKGLFKRYLPLKVNHTIFGKVLVKYPSLRKNFDICPKNFMMDYRRNVYLVDTQTRKMFDR